MNRIVLLFACLFISVTSFAQSPKSIEADLLKSFKKIHYWRYESKDTTGRLSDSLEKANNVFQKKLKNYTTKQSATIRYRFKAFNSQTLDICDSGDGKLRIYSWDTEMGGTMLDFRNVIQYATGNSTRSIAKADIATNGNEGYVYAYHNIKTFKANGVTYYIAFYYGKFSSHNLSEGIKIFSLKNGVLNEDEKIIKTKTGLHSKLDYYYDLFAIRKNAREQIEFDPATGIISLPVVLHDEDVTVNRITYKFTGKYFEKIKN